MSLKAALVDEIAEGGPIPFDSFMERALYDPGGGFFGSGELRSQRSGDFLTSPEVSTLFGEFLARFVQGELARIGEPFELVEVGAGSGSLLRPLLESASFVATAVEASPAARLSLEGILGAHRVRATMPDRVRGVILANELLDNLPMALAQRVDGSWRERWVGADEGDLHLVDAPVRPEVADWLGRYAGEVDDGGWVEVQLQAGEWLRAAMASLDEGALVAIDYGDTAEGLAPRRSDGTLRTYRSHHLGPHPLDEPGATDITADVNFTAMIDVARRQGAEVTLDRQDDFLAGLGLRDRLSELRLAERAAASQGDEMERLRIRTLKTEAETLLHPRGLGDFRVMVARI